MKSRVHGLLAATWLVTAFGCAGGLVLAPHRNRESELGPAATEGRYGAVLDRASNFEKQNAKSRDVYWYRVWRAAAMISLGQVEEGDQLVATVLDEMSSISVNTAEPERLRMFAFDLRAKAALARQQPAQALPFLDRALSFALEVKPDTGSRCDVDVMIASRHSQIADVAAAAGDADRSQRAHAQAEQKLEQWALCLGRQDFPALAALVIQKGVISRNGAPASTAAPASVPVAPAAAPPQPSPPPPALVAPPPVAPAPSAGSTGLSVQSVRYGPVDASPYRVAADNLVRLVERSYKGTQADALIRVDGSKRALRLRLPAKKLDGVNALIPVFKNTVMFFEQIREVQPKLDEVLIAVETPSGTTQVLAQRADVFDLFLDRLDDAGFLKRVVEVR